MDSDLLRAALAKIESLQSQMEAMQNSATTTPASSPKEPAEVTPHCKPKATAKAAAVSKGAKDCNVEQLEESPIRTPDGVPVS